VICNEDMSSVTEEDNWRVTWRNGAGWVHTRCDIQFSTGVTPDEAARANWEAWIQSEDYRRLCEDR